MRLKITLMNEVIIRYLKERKSLFFLLGGLLALFVIIKGISASSNALRVFEFAYIMLVIGLAPAYFFRKVFPFKNIIGWFTNASVLGLLFIPFFFLLFGWLQLNFVFVHSVSLLYFFSILSVLCLLFFSDKSLVNSYVSFNGLTIIDWFFYSVLVGFTAFLTVQNMSSYYPRWDVFTYWGLDAKYIFNFNQLRDSGLDIFWRFKEESSYLTITFSLIYDIYGKVVEQFASWLNVYINFLALFLIYNQSIKKNVLQKLLIVTALIIVSFTADDTAYMYSLYADIISPYLLLVFVLILTGKFDYDPKSYSARFFLLLLITFAFYFIKSKFLFLTIGLSLVLAIYDYRYWIKDWKKIIRNPLFILSVLTLLILWFAFFNYQLSVVGDYTIRSYVETFIPESNYSLISYLIYSKGLFNVLIANSRYITVLWAIGVASIIFIKNPLKIKSFIYTYILMIMCFLIYIVAYIYSQYPLLSGSLVRYTSIIIYLIPLLFTYSDFNIPKRLLETPQPQDIKMLKIIFMCILVFVISSLFNYKVHKAAPLGKAIKFVGGSFTMMNTLAKHSSLAENVLSIAEEDARILIADDKAKSNLVDNLNQSTIFIRYFLMNNSVGGQYRTEIDNLVPFAERYQADYILLLSYDNSLSNCEDLFEKGQDYLIALNQESVSIEGTCIFSDNVVYDLSDN